MELRTYIEILWRRKWIIVLTIVLASIAAFALTLLATPRYVATATLRVTTVGGEIVGETRVDSAYTAILMNTYAEIIATDGVRAEIMERLNLTERPSISVSLVRGTELMRVQAETTDPQVAQAVANTAADVIIQQSREQFSGGEQTTLDILAKQVEQLEAELAEARNHYETLLTESPEDTVALNADRQSIDLKQKIYESLLGQYENARVREALRANSVYVVEPANLPRTPSAPRREVNLILGLLAGLLGGFALAFLMENLDTKLRTSQQIAAVAQLPVIGEIPAAKQPLEIVHANNGHHPQAEAFRRLRINILAQTLEFPKQAILVTSAEAGEGKSTVVANLAVTIAQSGRRVVVVDCDMHDSTLHRLFQLRNDRGLTTILTGQASVVGVTQPSTYPRLHVLTSGPSLVHSADPYPLSNIAPVGLTEHLSQGIELLGSPKMATIIQQLKEEFDVVLLDSPALLDVSDAAVLVPLVDQVVFVVARQRADRDAVKTALRQLANVRARAVEVVINRAL